MKAFPHLVEAKRFGMAESKTLGDIAFCTHRILQSDVLEVEDAPKHHFGA